MNSLNSFDNLQLEDTIVRLFQRVRQPFNLGLREYLSALDLIQGGFGVSDLDDLKLTLQLLWCHSLPQQHQFSLIWHEVVHQSSVTSPEPITEENQHLSSEQKPQPIREDDLPRVDKELQQKSSQPNIKPLALKPQLTPTEIDDLPELKTYWPILRRSMAYAWRYLRRPRPDGPQDVLDISATIEQVAKTGFFLAPIYNRREVNHASLLLLLDQNGSMTPFHRFSRDLAETAMKDDSLTRTDVRYFHNVPITHVYRDPQLTQPVPLQEIWALCDIDTSVLIFSDAGAARGERHIERVRATTEFLVSLQQRTPLLGWLNPMPEDRWESTTAEMIGYLVRMKQMDKDGFSELIEIIRGQPSSVQG